MHDLRAVLLRHAVVKAQGYHLPLSLWQRLYRSAQCNIFNKLVLRAVVAEDKLKREAVLARLALDAVGRSSRRLGKSNVLRRDARLARKLRHRRLASYALFKLYARLTYLRGLLLDSAAHLDRPVIAQEAAYLAGYLRHSVGGKARAVALVEAVYRFQEADAAELVQIVRVDAAPEEPARDAPDKSGILLDQPLRRLPVALLCKAYRVVDIPAHRWLIRGHIYFCMVTVVPLPGVERTRSLSMKLPIIVKPMPLLSSPPVL